ncbi:LAFA_0E16050g1_1 [Lachancea sp. 'fantastica']|nr:LAFA_0E16050g1_1 [Lachancea sp. 'fantastica']
MTATFENKRRPSLLFDVDDEPTGARKFRSPSGTVAHSLDNTDMVALTTSFDKQISEGHPMYFEEDEILNDVEALDESGALVQCTKVNSEGKAGFGFIQDLRVKYIRESAQDAKSNMKNDAKNWFLYPKPLPKFWKFESDQRLYDEADSASMQGYFYTRADGDNFQNEKRVQLHYTGQFIKLSHFAKELEKFYNERGLPQAMATDYAAVVARIPSIFQFGQDFEQCLNIVTSEKMDAQAVKRTEYLLHRYELFQQLQGRSEIRESRLVPHRDFYNIRKVDQNYLLSGCISQRQLNDFIWEKLNIEPNRIVYVNSEGTQLTLRQIFCQGSDDESIGLKAVDDLFLDWYRSVYLSSDHLVRTDFKNPQNPKYVAIARTFLEFDNYIDGEYFAEMVVKYVIQSFEKSKYQVAQLSVDFQFDGSWWTKFSEWVTRWKLVSYNIRWNIRLNRCFTKLYSANRVQNFQDYLDHIFRPLLELEGSKSVELQFILSTVCCFDLVVSETDDYVWKSFLQPQHTSPSDWSGSGDNPPVAYYMFYIYQYLKVLNEKRKSRGRNTIALRNYCPITASRVSQFRKDLSITEQFESLICNFMLCEGGLLQAESLWRVSPTILYLYYLFQIPVVVSPLSSVSLLLEHGHSEAGRIPITDRDVTTPSTRTYTGNPFMSMHRMGLKVLLSSSSVLLNCSYTMEPIIEEYSVAASIYLLTSADMCELVRDSVLTSGYEGFYKAHWNGVRLDDTDFYKERIGLTDIWYDQEPDTCYKHNVPNARRFYRRNCLEREWQFING